MFPSFLNSQSYLHMNKEDLSYTRPDITMNAYIAILLYPAATHFQNTQLQLWWQDGNMWNYFQQNLWKFDENITYQTLKFQIKIVLYDVNGPRTDNFYKNFFIKNHFLWLVSFDTNKDNNASVKWTRKFATKNI